MQANSVLYFFFSIKNIIFTLDVLFFRGQMFRQALTKMFEAQEADAIFFETAIHLKRFPHMTLECVPLPISAGETAPIYFKVC